VTKTTNFAADKTVFNQEKALQLKEDIQAKQLEEEFKDQNNHSRLNV